MVPRLNNNKAAPTCNFKQQHPSVILVSANRVTENPPVARKGDIDFHTWRTSREKPNDSHLFIHCLWFVLFMLYTCTYVTILGQYSHCAFHINLYQKNVFHAKKLGRLCCILYSVKCFKFICTRCLCSIIFCNAMWHCLGATAVWL